MAIFAKMSDVGSNSTKINDTANSAMINNLIMMLMMTVVTPIITQFASEFTKRLAEVIPVIVDKIRRTVGPQKTTLEIKNKHIFTTKGNYVRYGPDQGSDDELIEAVTRFIRSKGITFARSQCVTSDKKVIFVPKDKILWEGFELEFTYSEINVKDGGKEITCQLFISSKRPAAEVRKFLEDCYHEYKESQDIVSTNQFYFKAMAGVQYNFENFLFKNPTTFDNIYYPEKERVIKLADKLKSGEINKMGLLLYGEPGTGKTSTIKALANYTGRHMFEIKLSLVQDDNELMHILYKENAVIKTGYGGGSHCEIPLSNRIYIFEDIDAECDIIADRAIKYKEKKEKEKEEKQKLTLSGILNALDGILELNGAIIVMTTNHVDKLDPALIRPGRVNMRIEMKKMLAVDANRMIKRFFGKKLPNIHDYVFTPATLESLCQSASDIEDLEQLISEYECSERN